MDCNAFRKYLVMNLISTGKSDYNVSLSDKKLFYVERSDGQIFSRFFLKYEKIIFF